MSIQQKIGDYGENLACEFLINKGYKIVERNWRFSRAEIDIIALLDDVLIFVEVKTRSYNYYGEPEDSVSKRKELMITEAAAAYMREIKHEWEFRFDIVSILLDKNEAHKIYHFEDAFFPGL